MGNAHYRGRFTFVVTSGDDMTTRDAPVQSFAPGSAKPIVFDTSADTAILTGLGDAKSQKSITLFKSATNDDFDAVLASLLKDNSQFGLNLDVYVRYTGAWIQIIHFFGEDATLKSKPVRVGGGKSALLKIETSFPSSYMQRNSSKKDGKYIDDDYWMM